MYTDRCFWVRETRLDNAARTSYRNLSSSPKALALPTKTPSKEDLVMRGNRLSFGLTVALVIFIVTLLETGAWASPREKVLHSFNGNDGAGPLAGLISDASGNLYGTTYQGGAGYGTVYELALSGGVWTETVLCSFTGRTDGGGPEAGVVFDKAGNLYGVTYRSGAHNYGTAHGRKA
jgi:uncharacterized repeat protein (TIGR03803 family)